jgi:protein-disulfide isomerase
MTMMNRMFKSPLVASVLAAGIGFAAPATALDIDNMSDAERQVLREEIRAYLLDNPEVIMEAVAILEQRDATAQARADRDLVAYYASDLFEDTHSWSGGNPEGDITLVEFIDYRCGFCRRAAPDVEELVEGDGNIRIVVKEFPILGEQSMLAARFAISTLQTAGDDAYKAVHDALITFEGDYTERSLRRLGDALGLDGSAIVDGMESPAVNDAIAANHQLARALQISGTPSFVMDDRMLRGYLPLAEMQALAAEIRQE